MRKTAEICPVCNGMQKHTLFSKDPQECHSCAGSGRVYMKQPEGSYAVRDALSLHKRMKREGIHSPRHFASHVLNKDVTSLSALSQSERQRIRFHLRPESIRQ